MTKKTAKELKKRVKKSARQPPKIVFRPTKNKAVDRRKVKRQWDRILDKPIAERTDDDWRYLQSWTRLDKTVAKHPSRLRWYDEAPSLIQRLDAFREDGDIVGFEAEAHDIAEEFQLPVGEVYTLFWSH